MDRLVHQHAAARGGPAAAPVAVGVVGGVAEPAHRRPAAQHRAELAAVEQLPQLPGGVVVAVLEADARAPRLLSSAAIASRSPSARLCASGFSSSTDTSAGQALDAISACRWCGVQMCTTSGAAASSSAVSVANPGSLRLLRGRVARRCGSTVADPDELGARPAADRRRGGRPRCRRSRPRPTRNALIGRSSGADQRHRGERPVVGDLVALALAAATARRPRSCSRRRNRPGTRRGRRRGRPGRGPGSAQIPPGRVASP